jgi:hypothetical protein
MKTGSVVSWLERMYKVQPKNKIVTEKINFSVTLRYIDLGVLPNTL